MSGSSKKEKYVVIPYEIFVNAQTIDDIEDWLMLQNDEFLKGLVEARRQHLAGEMLSLEEVKAKLGL
jgi:hypothetical protein